MSRNVQSQYLDRLYASLPYLLPIASVVSFGNISLFSQIPILETIFKPVLVLDQTLSHSIIDFISIRLVVWFSIFFLVVRNYEVSQFIRFNSIQALLLDIIVILVGVIVSLIGQLSFLFFVLEILLNATFIGINAAFLYCVFRCVRGEYAEIPIISEAARYQVR
ncbi:MAG: hypothetical protein DCE90_03910 [Pseudanabaena sp.]|nr:MAG: hypothetical protein DCE90_03910 [Pseudanabaena sp.]